MAKRFSSPIYNVTISSGERVAIDVTNSISSGLDPNQGLIDEVVAWMTSRGYKRVLDFGAGALRHSLPLLKKGFEVIAVEYERAYQRPKAKVMRAQAEGYDGFTELVWPNDFLKCDLKYVVALLVYVLQVIPVKKERDIVLSAIADRFDRNGPKRLYYASRFGEARTLPDDTKYNDGWVRGVGVNDRSFYTEWNAANTDKFFKSCGYERAGSYVGATQPYIYDYQPGVL